MRKRTGKYVIWAGMSLLLIFLPACSGLTSSNEDVKPTITPLTLTATSQSTAISITPNPSSNDWTTYHANNQRTGYIADTPDPHNLSKIWSTQLDGSVYAEPLVVGNRVIVATAGCRQPRHRCNRGRLALRTGPQFGEHTVAHKCRHSRAIILTPLR